MTTGMGQAYATLQNELTSMVVEGEAGAVVSHIAALAAKHRDRPSQAEVMNFFGFREGKISYRRNVHDSKPVAPFLRQI